jgi:hypothetical protein
MNFDIADELAEGYPASGAENILPPNPRGIARLVVVGSICWQ